MPKYSKGFTLIETLIAIAIYAVLVSAMVVASQTGLRAISKSEETALARRALQNVVIEFKTGANANRTGRFNGQYQMSHFNYQWEIKVERSQNQQMRVLTAKIGKRDAASSNGSQRIVAPFANLISLL